MLPLVPLVALGGVALLALTKKQAPPPSSAAGTGSALAPTQPTGLASGIAGIAGGILAATGAVAGLAYQAGSAADQALNPNSDPTSRAIAGAALTAPVVAVGVLGALAVLLPVLGITAALIGIVGGIVLAAGLLVYGVTLIIQDASRLAYGQAGAMRDFLAAWNTQYNACKTSLLAQHPEYTATQVARQLRPFVEGIFARYNWSTYQAALAKNGVVVSGDPTVADATKNFPIIGRGQAMPGTNVVATDAVLWNTNFWVDRGYFIGQCPGQRLVGSDADFDAFFQASQASTQSDWVLAHCPANAVQKRVVRTADSFRQEAIAKAHATDFLTVSTNELARAAAGGGGVTGIGPQTGLANAMATQAAGKGLTPPIQVTPPKYVNPAAPYATTNGVGPEEAKARAALYVDLVAYSDPIRSGYFAAGWVFGDLSLYKAQAEACKGDVPTLRAAAKAKAFEGDILDDGSLSYVGVVFKWNAP